MPKRYVKKAIIQNELIVKAKEVRSRCKKAQAMINHHLDGKVSWRACLPWIDKREKAKEELFEIIQQL